MQGLRLSLDVERWYARLIAGAGTLPAAEPSLGGKLLYAGELDFSARTLLIAANIAGAASLAATADVAQQKQAFRDGVVDFLVNSLDEALRILKNQLRKRETAAVCIASDPSCLTREMIERGVLPNLLPPDSFAPPEWAASLRLGAGSFVASEEQKSRENEKIVVWSVAEVPAVWLPKLDALAADCLPAEDWAARRWLRLSPRYLGRLAQGVRLMRCEAAAALSFEQRVRKSVAGGEIGVAVDVQSFSLPAASIRAQSSFTP